ncbi:Phosphotransferase enzyme family protein [Salinivirga cyanobacteriivorans]|uniref:Phosphotransferase enzyme family protein n=1 Tax=Salinivirga cyanobacteriivorans TaxID=1307839 RepID=A0A0S2I3Z2_9BACT|nr:aminoglycoside phosphotransferase family protein [Salinivirga cyanobacteriivorans]ALO16951.1 Phosphotransferase enzyme family protein [Salinivirga cyanobacteriivorans]
MELPAREILSLFLPGEMSPGIEPLGNGHINDTFLVRLSDGCKYVLQRLNQKVFKDTNAVMHNYKLLENNFLNNVDVSLPGVYRSVNNNLLEFDKHGNPWRLIEFVEYAYSLDHIVKKEQSYQAGFGYGAFLKGCAKCPVGEFQEVIPEFHNLKWRMQQLDLAVEQDNANRLSAVTDLVSFYRNQYVRLNGLIAVLNSREIPVRIVHNDTKINNLMYRGEQVRAVVDLDTVGPGSVIYDFGDAIRTIANSSDEDEQELGNVAFNMDFFKAFAQGYLSQTKDMLTDTEKFHLWQAPLYMTLIMGVRFLTDYLNGDIYYKTEYESHNLVRTRVQSKLIASMETNYHPIKTIVEQMLTDNQ